MRTLFECGLVVDGNTVNNRLICKTVNQDIDNRFKYKWLPLTEADFIEAVEQENVIFYDMIDGEPCYNVQGQEDVNILAKLPRMVNLQSQHTYLDNYKELLPRFNVKHFHRAQNNPKVIACSIREVVMYSGFPFINLACYNNRLSDFIGYVYERYGDLNVKAHWEDGNVAELLVRMDFFDDPTFTQGEYKLCISPESIEAYRSLDDTAKKVWHVNKDIRVANDKALDLLMEHISEINRINESTEFVSEHNNLAKYLEECGFATKEEQDKEVQRLYELFKVNTLDELNEQVVVLLTHE